MGLLRSKVGGVVLTAVLIGTVGGVLAARSAAPQGSVALTTANDSSTATASASPTATPTATRTATASPSPTRVPRPTATAPQLIDIHGKVASVDTTTNTFTLTVTLSTGVTTTKTCTVNENTQWQGISGMSALQVGQVVTVTGHYRSSGSFSSAIVRLGANT
jgi:Domain of unknown function (DUF5666)